MKKLLFLMLLSSNIYAQSCTEIPGDITVDVSQRDNDAYIEYSMKLHDPYYPLSDLFMLKITACFDNECRSASTKNINPPQGYIDHVKYVIKSPSLLSKGDHVFLYEMLITRYGCEAKSKTIIKVN